MAQPIESWRVYAGVYAALILLTGLTVGLDYVELGPWHNVAGLGIAAAKTALVALFFMHVWHSSRVTWLVALSGLFWLAVLIGLTLTDVETRYWSLE